MTNFEAVLQEFAQETTMAAQRNLGSRKIGKNRSYGVSTRKLQRSLTFSIQGGSVTFGSPVPYAGFVHWGVNGTKKKHGSPYSYTNKQPPVDAILKWMRVKPVRLRDKNGQFIPSTPYVSEKTGKEIDPMRSAAFGIASAIKRKGMPGVKYWTEAYETMWPKYAKKLAEAKAEDVVIQLQAQIGNITIKTK